MVGVESGPQMPQKVLDLVDGDGVADAGVDAAAFLERAAAVDADQFAVHVEKRAAAVARVDRRINLNAVGVFEERAGRVLIAVDAAYHAISHGRREVGGQQERIAQGQRPVAGSHRVAVAHFGEGELLAFLVGKQLDEGHVTDLVKSDQNGMIENAVGQAALHDRPGAADDVEVRQGVAVLV